MDYCENIAVFAFLWVVLRRDLCKDGSDKKKKKEAPEMPRRNHPRRRPPRTPRTKKEIYDRRTQRMLEE